MDYKKIIKSRKMRLKILSLLRFIPDKTMLKIQYRIKLGRKLDLKNPKRFSEKLQWYKLNYKNPLMIQCVDKYDVREYIKSKGYSDILIPCYGVFDSVEEINWEQLPSSFVIKDTLGGGGNGVIIVKDKSTMNLNAIKDRCREWTNINHHLKDAGREWPYYSGRKHRIIIEEMLVSNNNLGLSDYKFFCFNGHADFLQYMTNRKLGSGAEVGIFDREFSKMHVKRIGDPVLSIEVERPDNYLKMIEIADKLSTDFPHARIDLYNVNGKIFFGEITFFGASGYLQYEPDYFDFELGKLFIL